MRRNRYERMLQEIFGYTDEQLLEEVRLAEEELEQMGDGEPVSIEECNALLERFKSSKNK